MPVFMVMTFIFMVFGVYEGLVKVFSESCFQSVNIFRLMDNLDRLQKPAILFFRYDSDAICTFIRAFNRNNPDYASQPVIKAYFLTPVQNAALIKAFPGRKIYVCDIINNRLSFLEVMDNSESAFNYYIAGRNYSHCVEDHKKAEKWLKKSLEISPDNFDVMWELAQLYIEDKDAQKGIPVLKKLLASRVYAMQASYFLARFYQEAGNKDEARKLFNVVINYPGPDNLIKERARMWGKW